MRAGFPRDLNCLEQDSQDLHDLQDYLPRNKHSFCNGCLFRSVRTCMSIEKRGFRSFQGLTDLKPPSGNATVTVARGPVPRECSIQTKNATVTVARGPVPRNLSAETKNARSPETTDVYCHDRCMARDRPSPYGGRRGVLDTVVRGAVPRERSVV